MKKLAAVAAAGAGAIVVPRVLRRRRVLERVVADDLRSPVLYALPSVTSDRALGLVRRLSALAPSTMPAGCNERHTPGGVRVLVYEPAHGERPRGAVVWIHGGGMVMGRPEQSHADCLHLVEAAGVVVVSVDYRLAPEHPFPAPLDDCMAALAWVHDEAEALGVDPARVAVGGDSAGGGLAAAVAQRAHDEGGPPLAVQLLVYPMLDDRTVLRIPASGPDDVHLWSPASNRYGWTSYLGHEPVEAAAPPYASPARRVDLSGLAPAWIGVGDLDLFHAEDLDYAKRLEEAGVPCQLHVAAGMWHGAPSVLPGRATTTAMRDSMTAALLDAFA